MQFNSYGQQLSPEDIDAKAHRDFVGGMWDEIGILQFNFMKKAGLQHRHRLLDIGCGALRGGVHFVRYLDVGHYFGMDINASLLEAGERELAEVQLTGREPHLLCDDHFSVDRFNTTFDAVLAVSVFTHLPMNHIIRCLCEVAKVLGAQARFYASYFDAPANAHLTPIKHAPGDIVTNFDTDPFHYSFAEIQWMAQSAGLTVERIGGWEHPRDQQMLAFSLPH
jgi:cyclopropane fatty-acyl-phospholipid synthase-like methyltransferase